MLENETGSLILWTDTPLFFMETTKDLQKLPASFQGIEYQ